MFALARYAEIVLQGPTNPFRLLIALTEPEGLKEAYDRAAKDILKVRPKFLSHCQLLIKSSYWPPVPYKCAHKFVSALIRCL